MILISDRSERLVTAVVSCFPIHPRSKSQVKSSQYTLHAGERHGHIHVSDRFARNRASYHRHPVCICARTRHPLISCLYSGPRAQPDSKTRRYDRQLRSVFPYHYVSCFASQNINTHRLWAASGQAALESSRTLVLAASATSTSILKNLVLPGIGHFTILDSQDVTSADAGNNFFLNGYSSIGKNRAEEALPLLNELNDSVDGKAVKKSVDELLQTEEGRKWLKGFSLVIAHNLAKDTLDTLSKLLWDGLGNPPLIVVRSAGFIADFYIQFHEQCST